MRGRPAGQMTQRRQQVLTHYADMITTGEKVKLAELARRCNLCDYREARRIVGELKRYGAMA